MPRPPLAAFVLAFTSVIAPTASSADVGSGRDPFAVSGADVVAPACVTTRGLACVGLDRLRLCGVVTGTASPRPLLEDDADGSHIVRVGDVVDGLRVTGLRRDRVALERTLRTFEGGLVRRAVELRL